MQQFLRQALHWENLPFLVLLAVALLYWVLVVLGVLRSKTLDVWLGTDYLADKDEQPKTLLLKLLRAGSLPMAVSLTILIVLATAASLTYTTQLVGYGAWLTFVLLPVNLVLSVLLTFVVTEPFKREAPTVRVDAHALEGQMAVVTSPADHLTTGQATLSATGTTVNIRALTADLSLEPDTDIILMKYETAGNYYFANLVRAE